MVLLLQIVFIKGEYTMHDVLCASTELCESKNIKYNKVINLFGNNYNIVGHEVENISLDSQIADIEQCIFS